MIQWNRFWIAVLCAALISGCAYLTTTRTAKSKSYALNIEEQAFAGVPMVSSQSIVYVKGTGKYGHAEEQQRWKSQDYPTRDSHKEELIYTGRTANVLHFKYKKYKNLLSTPSFSEKLDFNIGSTDTIKFKNYEIKILNATSEYIRFKVLSD